MDAINSRANRENRDSNTDTDWGSPTHRIASSVTACVPNSLAPVVVVRIPGMSTRFEFKRLASCLFALAALAALPLHLRAQQPLPEPITLATLVEVMEAREKLADSVTVRWTQNERYRARALLSKPSTWTSSCEMLLKGGSMRYAGKMFSHSGGDVTQIDHVSSYDGKESRALQGAKPPRGFILDLGDEETANEDAAVPALQPLMLYFRPLAEPNAMLRRKTLKLLDERKTVDGRECVTVDDGRTRVYLDRDRDFVPVAFQRYSKNLPVVYDGSLEYYRKQNAPRWLPKAFQVTMRVAGPNIADRIRGDGVQTTIGVPLKDSDFSLKFGPGTIFWDMRTRQQYRVRDNGSNELIPRRRGMRGGRQDAECRIEHGESQIRLRGDGLPRPDARPAHPDSARDRQASAHAQEHLRCA